MACINSATSRRVPGKKTNKKNQKGLHATSMLLLRVPIQCFFFYIHKSFLIHPQHLALDPLLCFLPSLFLPLFAPHLRSTPCRVQVQGCRQTVSLSLLYLNTHALPQLGSNTGDSHSLNWSPHSELDYSLTVNTYRKTSSECTKGWQTLAGHTEGK